MAMVPEKGRAAPRTYVAALALAVLVLGSPKAGAADRLDRILAQGEMRLGFRSAAAPFSDAEPGKPPTGYSIELCMTVADAISARNNRPIRPVWVEIATGERFDRLADGSIDLLCEATTVTLARRERVEFSLFTWVTSIAAAVRTGQGPRDLDQLAKARSIGVVFGTTADAALRPFLEARGIRVPVLEAEGHEVGLSLLSAGQYDVYLGDREILAARIEALGLGDRVEILANSFSNEPYALGLPPGEHRLRLETDRALAELFRSGGIEAIRGRTIPGPVPPLVQAIYQLQALPK